MDYVDADEEGEELHLSAQEARYDGGLAPGADLFPRATMQRYRALVILPLLLLLLAVTSLPFLVLSIVFWNDECTSGNSWWYRPTTLCAVSNGILMCTVPFLAFSIAKAHAGEDESPFMTFAFLLVCQWGAKGLELASVIAAPIITHWCNEWLIVIVDILVGSLFFICPVFTLLLTIADAETKGIDVKLVLGRMCYGLALGCVMLLVFVIAFSGIALFFSLQIASAIVGVLALVDAECGGSIWMQPALPLVVTSVISLLGMGLMMVIVLNVYAATSCKTCKHVTRNSLMLLPFLLTSVAGALWITVTLVRGECNSEDRVWWFGLAQAVYCYGAPVAWIMGISIIEFVIPFVRNLVQETVKSTTESI